MIEMRREQMEAFRQQAMANFEDRAVDHLRRKLAEPTEGISDEQLRQRVRSSVPRAKAYEFITEQQIIAFVDATYYLGEWFDTDPRYAEVVALLRDETIAADTRAGVLLGLAHEEHDRAKTAGITQ